MDPKDSSNLKSMNKDDFVKAVNHALDHGYGPHLQSKLFDGDVFSWINEDYGVSSAKESFEVPPKVVKSGSKRMAFLLSLMHADKRIILSCLSSFPESLDAVIADGIAVGSDIGEISMLKKYEADRKMANVAMMAILDGFQKAYSVDFGPQNVLRAAAFHGAQYISPLKRNILSYASSEQRIPLLS
ncbi:hypothetical protein LguiB_013690 [Lonicera macranthoides]